MGRKSKFVVNLFAGWRQKKTNYVGFYELSRILTDQNTFLFISEGCFFHQKYNSVVVNLKSISYFFGIFATQVLI